MVCPGSVWGDARGTLGVMADDITEGRLVPVIGSIDMRWPLVHRDGFAALNVAALAPGVADAAYHGVTEAGLRVGDMLADVGAMVGRRAGHRIMPFEQALAKRGARRVERGAWSVERGAWARRAAR
jgi:hypothetical protein